MLRPTAWTSEMKEETLWLNYIVTLCRRVASDPWRQPYVVAPLHPALSLASLLVLLMVALLECPLSVASHLCIGLPLLLATFILPRITSIFSLSFLYTD